MNSMIKITKKLMIKQNCKNNKFNHISKIIIKHNLSFIKSATIFLFTKLILSKYYAL